MNLAAAATAFVIVFLAELPDKTALASLVLGSRYRASWVFAGVAAAFATHVVLAVAAGSLLTLLPHRVLEAIIAALFLVGAVLLLTGHDDQDEEVEQMAGPAGFWRVSGTSFGIILVAEFGDLTQIVTANLAAKYHDPYAVGLGAVLGLWAVGALAIVGGRNLLKVVPLKWITRLAAGIMLVLAVISLITVIRG